MIQCRCKTCDKEIIKKNYLVKKFGEKVYCSKKCYYESIRIPLVIRKCEQCEKEFKTQRSNIKWHGARFCSKGCKDSFNHGQNSYKWSRTEKVCINCNNMFLIETWRLKDGRSKRGKYCSTRCRDQYQVGENATNWGDRNGQPKENHYNWRKKVLERDNKKCIWCGETRNLHADHIKPVVLFPELRFDIDNGRTLCVDCHKKTDTWGKVRAAYKEMLQ